MKSLAVLQHPLSSPAAQLDVLSSGERKSFKSSMENAGLYPLKPTGIEIFQVNVGKQCNQTCKHCHVDAGPDRKERMSRETMEQCLDIIKNAGIHTVDITGGAPEMHPDFRWFVAECAGLGKKVMVRCNLTIILANKKYHDLPEFYKQHDVEVVSSLPFYNADRTDRQRGAGVFEQSIKALQLLNAVGYGIDGSGLLLNLVYNPSGAFLPGSQHDLEVQFKKALLKDYAVSFNNLFTITNIPISRFLEFLVSSGNYDAYMEKLINAFNPLAAEGVMCRNTISVSWDGYLYDCDFNQMLNLQVDQVSSRHISSFNLDLLNKRSIVLNQHCYGCTAGAGSSCGGATV
ncbi:arsenosugar biosynthesis radical SAM (seleno)protein ArsS [Rubrolithibacter danxiaensis]|uniref:arsenosugar biosynthesis radical SAM (seleno)protein ArsS n=1 Tax=Rubrolithibacter danxiaensis TaxID=3390805 RepID=UPI003BF8F442